MRKGWGKYEGFITAKASADIYYLTHKYLHSDKETRKVLSRLYVLFELLDTAGIDCRKAISSEMSDYEDGVMVETALRCGMDCIVTRNVKDYGKSPVKIYEPVDFIGLFS